MRDSETEAGDFRKKKGLISEGTLRHQEVPHRVACGGIDPGSHHVALCKACLTDTGQRKVRAVRGGTRHPSHRVQITSLEVQRQDWEMRTPDTKTVTVP